MINKTICKFTQEKGIPLCHCSKKGVGNQPKVPNSISYCSNSISPGQGPNGYRDKFIIRKDLTSIPGTVTYLD